MYNSDRGSFRRIGAVAACDMDEGIKAVKQRLNQFLITEFGVDSEGGTRPGTENWPFTLMPVGRISSGPGVPDVFRIELEEPYYVLDIGAPHCYPTAGMTISDLEKQFLGASWLATQEPIDLSTSATGLLGVPSIPERREAVTSMVTASFGSEASFKILECLYLRKSLKYFALVEMSETKKVFLIGPDIQPLEIQFPMASGWRRLASGVGLCIRDGKIISR
ncbi:MAG: hypothetical protein JW929_05765 [Anaerolineales bacterium]|nr:hypothetical protein [Anaerolineales bacterium]